LCALVATQDTLLVARYHAWAALLNKSDSLREFLAALTHLDSVPRVFNLPQSVNACVTLLGTEPEMKEEEARSEFSAVVGGTSVREQASVPPPNGADAEAVQSHAYEQAAVEAEAESEAESEAEAEAEVEACEGDVEQPHACTDADISKFDDYSFDVPDSPAASNHMHEHSRACLTGLSDDHQSHSSTVRAHSRIHGSDLELADNPMASGQDSECVSSPVAMQPPAPHSPMRGAAAAVATATASSAITPSALPVVCLHTSGEQEAHATCMPQAEPSRMISPKTPSSDDYRIHEKHSNFDAAPMHAQEAEQPGSSSRGGCLHGCVAGSMRSGSALAIQPPCMDPGRHTLQSESPSSFGESQHASGLVGGAHAYALESSWGCKRLSECSPSRKVNVPGPITEGTTELYIIPALECTYIALRSC
jgi:hypothetical protein